MPITLDGPYNFRGFTDPLNLHVENVRFRVVGEEGTGNVLPAPDPLLEPSQQVCPRAVLPGCQGVVGHVGKVQKWE